VTAATQCSGQDGIEARKMLGLEFVARLGLGKDATQNR
jgi:hypothetical protein